MKKLTFRSAVAALAACTVVTVGGIAPAFADDPKLYFELDGNIFSDGATPGPDWSDIFQATSPAGATAKSPLPAGFNSPTFVLDFNPTGTNDVSTYATGSKDTLNITPGWQCVKSNNVNDKTDINNAYAVAYTNPNNHLIVYFALDVAANEGTKDVGFWFLKDGTVSCNAGGKATPFTGNHSDGDVLIVSEYTSGGRVATIVAYKWVGGAGGFLDPNPIGTGGDCRDGAFDVCARTNGSVLKAGTGVPWLVKTKPSNPQGSGYSSPADLDTGEFFEGGIDMTALGISGCFNRYLADTRSSVSLTATIFDYALGNFSNCSIGASKTCTLATVNPDFTTFTSGFTVTITNTSPSGSVHDVSFKETFNFGQTGETCSITSNSGDQNVVGLDVTSGNVVKVQSELAAGASVNVGVTCTGPLNSFQDSILASAGSTAGASDITKVAAVSTESAAACQAAVQGGLEIQKVCRGMELVGGSAGTPITLKAKVKISVTNPATSNEQVTITSVTDTKVTTLQQVSCVDLATPSSDVVLNPGETACYLGEYTPTAGDLVNPPSTASFTDSASATAVGSISGSFTAGPVSATCLLCDSDNDGIPDVIDR